MVSGKYSSLSGAVAREQAMSQLTNSLANVNSTGFKKERISFESLLKGSKQTTDAKGINYSRIRKIGIDFSQGPLRETGRSLDVAISGDGFFKVRRGNETLYTRNGNFFADENGMLKTAQGFNVLNETNQPIQIPDIEGKKLHIDESGSIALNTTPSGEKIQVFSITDNEKLTKAGDTMFRLERGAVSRPLVTMIDTQRKYDANLKVLKSYSTLSEKQNQLGTVG